MSSQMPTPPPDSSRPPPGSFVRVEYLDFEDVEEHREFRLRVCRREGSKEFRLRIATAAFGAAGVRMQDGPDICYQKLQRVVAAGEDADRDLMTLDDVELVSWRVGHVQVPKHRSWSLEAPAPAPSPSPTGQSAEQSGTAAAPAVSDDRTVEKNAALMNASVRNLLAALACVWLAPIL